MELETLVANGANGRGGVQSALRPPDAGMTLAEAVERLLVATVADGRSPRTVRDYRQKLAGLVEFLGPGCEIGRISAHDLRRYVASLRGRQRRYRTHIYRGEIDGPLSPATIAGSIRAIKRLFSFLEGDQVISENPARGLRAPRMTKGREPKAVSKADFVKLLRAAEGDEPAEVRDRALLLFLADTGARVGGLVGLELDDLDLDQSMAWVTEKGNKRRAVYLSGETVAALRAWLRLRQAQPTQDRPGSQAVFTSLHKTRGGLTREGVTLVLRRLKKRAGVTGPVNPHAFRHAFAREYLRNGGDLATLSDLMGHSDIQVTATSYAVFLPDELQERHRRFSPVAQLSKDGEL